MRQRVPQLSLLVKFSLLSLLAIGLMGAALAHVLKDQIRERAAADAERMATRIANDLVDQHVTRPDLEGVRAKPRCGSCAGSVATPRRVTSCCGPSRPPT
jgi:hypothetical protein